MSEYNQRTDVRAHRSAANGQPLISVCIATRNRDRYLAMTLDNILEQCGYDLEVVVVDGASTDDTAAVVGARATNWPNLKYYPQAANSGIDGIMTKQWNLPRVGIAGWRPMTTCLPPARWLACSTRAAKSPMR